MSRTVSLQPDLTATNASIAANTSAIAANTSAIAANTSAIAAKAKFPLVWGANNDNGAANGWPVANGNCIANANNGSEVAAVFRLPAGTVLSRLLCTYTNANPASSPVYTVRKNGAGNTTMADTTITCAVTNATINGTAGGKGSDTSHTETVLDSGDGYGYVSLHKTGSANQASNYAGTFTLDAQYP
jgi:hypothetical protein